ncbi:hypothetical protein EDD85DRAFT_798445 [Armillaria nabsnona]|nr:hypothetical protein EDD85DRAFT_798445 [Armillaria nabsnona]
MVTSFSHTLNATILGLRGGGPILSNLRYFWTTADWLHQGYGIGSVTRVVRPSGVIMIMSTTVNPSVWLLSLFPSADIVYAKAEYHHAQGWLRAIVLRDGSKSHLARMISMYGSRPISQTVGSLSIDALVMYRFDIDKPGRAAVGELVPPFLSRPFSPWLRIAGSISAIRSPSPTANAFQVAGFGKVTTLTALGGSFSAMLHILSPRELGLRFE